MPNTGTRVWRAEVIVCGSGTLAFSAVHAIINLLRNLGIRAGKLFSGGAFVFASFAVCSPGGAATISITDIGTFDVPDRFTSLSAEEIKVHYVRGRPPAFASGNEKRTTMISYEVRAMTVPTDQLREVKSTVETTMAQSLPGLVWKKTDIVKIQGRSSLYFEHVSPGPDYDTHNIFLWIPLAQKSLFMNFSCPIAEFPKMEPVFRQSIRSISLTSP